MKKLQPKTLSRFAVVILIVLAVSFMVYSQYSNKINENYSTSNTGFLGLSLFSRTLEDLKYKTNDVVKPIEQVEGSGLQVLTLSNANATLDVTISMILDKAMAESRLLILYPADTCANLDLSGNGYELLSKEAYTSVDEGDYTIQTWKNDADTIIMTSSSDLLVNLYIADDPDYSYLLLTKMHPYMSAGVTYNEYFLYWQAKGTSLWLDMPLWIKIVLCQLFVVILCFILYKGKRFGKARKYLDEEEADENQYPIAVGELYHQAGYWELALDSYHQHFLQTLNRSITVGLMATATNWLEIWTREGFGNIPQARKAFSFLQKTAQNPNSFNARSKSAKKKKAKKMKEIVLCLQGLEEIMAKRGVQQWNLLKSSQSSKG